MKNLITLTVIFFCVFTVNAQNNQISLRGEANRAQTMAEAMNYYIKINNLDGVAVVVETKPLGKDGKEVYINGVNGEYLGKVFVSNTMQKKLKNPYSEVSIKEMLTPDGYCLEQADTIKKAADTLAFKKEFKEEKESSEDPFKTKKVEEEKYSEDPFKKAQVKKPAKKVLEEKTFCEEQFEAEGFSQRSLAQIAISTKRFEESDGSIRAARKSFKIIKNGKARRFARECVTGYSWWKISEGKIYAAGGSLITGAAATALLGGGDSGSGNTNPTPPEPTNPTNPTGPGGY